MSKLINAAVDTCKSNDVKFFKYISSSDAGKSKSHQAGIYIPKEGASIMFETPCKKGENKEKFVTIEWYDGIIKESCRFVYYGKSTRNEFRITCTRKKLEEGDYLIMVKIREDYYKAFVLSNEHEVNLFYQKLVKE